MRSLQQHVLAVERVAFAYGDASPVLSDISFAAKASEVVAIVGRNGAGKSTLLRLLNGLRRPTTGTIVADGCSTATTPVHVLARHVGTVFQGPEQQIFNATVRREVAFGPRQLGLRGAALDERVDGVLERAGLTAHASTHPLDLDGATLRLVALASVLAMRPPIILLDEPQRGLDARASERLESIIVEEAAHGTCIVLVCHDMDFVARRADRVVAIANGGVAADGTTAAFFADAALTRAAGVELPDTVAIATALGLPPALTPAALAASWLNRSG
jgi:energy-coupling factor transport system ATP-binding protein